MNRKIQIPILLLFLFFPCFYFYFTPRLVLDPVLVAKVDLLKQTSEVLAVENRKSNHAFVTLLSSDNFLPGTIVLIESLVRSKSDKDIVVMVLPHISNITRERLEKLPVTQVNIDYIENPYKEKMVSKRQQHNFSKLRAWLLCEYEKIVLIGIANVFRAENPSTLNSSLDSDVAVLRNIDDLFSIPQKFAAVKNFESPFSTMEQSTFNSGLLVIEPSQAHFQNLVDHFLRITSYNGGDQGFLNAYYGKNWYQLDLSYNINKMIFKYEPKLLENHLPLKVIHYVRSKPWFDTALLTEVNEGKQLLDRPSDYRYILNLWKKFLFSSSLNTNPNDLLPISNISRKSYVYENKLHRLLVIHNFCPLSSYFGCPFTDNAFTSKSITLATQFSSERLPALSSLSQDWEGPISATIIVSRKNLRSFLLRYLYSDLPFSRISTAIVIQESEAPYPINILRNIAIQSSTTDMVFYLDIDFRLPEKIYKNILNSRKYEHIYKSSLQYHAFVVPAFETEFPFCTGFNQKGCIPFPNDKKQVLKYLDKRLIISFHEPKLGHRPTNITHWKQADSPYYVQWENWYEPYLILRKSAANFTWFDERFLDRGRNKMILSLELYARGFRFVVLPNVFTIHKYEETAERKNIWLKPMKNKDIIYKDLSDKIFSSNKCSDNCTSAKKWDMYEHDNIE